MNTRIKEGREQLRELEKQKEQLVLTLDKLNDKYNSGAIDYGSYKSLFDDCIKEIEYYNNKISELKPRRNYKVYILSSIILLAFIIGLFLGPAMTGYFVKTNEYNKYNKVQSDPGFEVIIDSSIIKDGNLIVKFHHNSLTAKPIAVIGDVEYGLSKNSAEQEEIITLTVYNYKNQYFRLKVGEHTEIIEFGENNTDAKAIIEFGENITAEENTAGIIEFGENITNVTEEVEFGENITIIENITEENITKIEENITLPENITEEIVTENITITENITELPKPIENITRIIENITNITEDVELSKLRNRIKIKNIDFKRLERINNKFRLDIDFNTTEIRKGRIEIEDLEDINELKEIKIIKPIEKIKNIKFNTEVIAVNKININNATITLPKEGKVNRIVRCENFNFNDSSCDNWQVTDIPFTDNGDSITFTVNSFSAYGGAEITILNAQSYPTVGGNWTVRFTTEGTADLIIKAANGTSWSNSNENNDLKFLEIKCGDEILDYEWKDDSIFIANYSCNEIGYEISKVLTAGKHTLEFRFGDDVEYAHNQAGTSIKTVEYWIGTSNRNTETLRVSATAWVAINNSNGIKVYLPENNVNVKMAWLVFNAYAGAVTDTTAISVGFNNKKYTPVTALYGDQSTEQYSLWALVNVTDAFASFSNPMTVSSANVTVTGPITGGHGLKLIVTYSYDTSSTVFANTVKFPIASKENSLNNSNAYKSSLVNYNATIKEAATSDVTSAWFEIAGFADGIDVNDAKILARININTPDLYHHIETGSGSQYDIMYYFNVTSGTNFTLNQQQTLNISAADTSSLRAVGGELVVTYNYSSSATRRTKTISYFMGQGTATSLTTRTTFNKNINLPESNVAVKYIWAKVGGGHASTTLGTLKINGSIDGVKAAGKAYWFRGLLGTGYQPIIYDMSSLANSLVSGSNVSIDYQYSVAANSPAGIDLYITYEYDESSTYQMQTVRYFGGQTPTITTSNTFRPDTWVFEESPQLVSGYVETTVTDTDGTDPTWTTTIGGSSSVAVATESLDIFFYKILNGDANRILNATSTNYTLVLSSGSNTGGSQVIFLTYNYTAHTPADVTPPVVAAVVVNDTEPRVNENYNISCTATDVALDRGWCGWNNSGSWVNFTAEELSGASGKWNCTGTITLTRGKILGVACYANDTTNNQHGTYLSDTIEDTYATWNHNGTNFSSIKVNENGMFNITVYDADGLNSSIFSLKNSTGAIWYNYSALRISGTSYELKYNLTVSSNATQVLSWMYYFNDSSGAMYNSSVFNIVISDTYATWSRNGTNFTSIKVNENGMFNVTVNDADGLASAIFSLKNSTGAIWYNYSALRISGTSYELKYNLTVSSNATQVLSWRYYFNDSTGTMYNSSVFNIVISDIYATWNHNGTNFTSIKVNENGMFNVTVNDADGLASAIFSLKNSSGAAWYNYSALSISGTSYELKYNLTVSSNASQVLSWRYYFNDSSGTMYNSSVFNIVISDTYATWSRNGTNFTSIKVNENGMFNVTITEPDGLARCIFSLKNSTNADWYNYSALDVSGTSYELRYNLTISSNASQVITWRYYCNDSSGTMYNSTLNNIVIADTAATFTQVGINASTIYQYENVRFNATVTDADELAMYIFSMKNGTAGTWYNYSAVAIPKGRTNYFINTSHSISTAASDTQYWRYYVNDSNVMYDTGEQSFTVTSADSAAPYYTFNRTNFTSIKVNEHGQFNVTVTDANSNLDTVIFAIRNDTAAWQNYTTLRITSNIIDLAFNLTISLTYGEAQYWKFYANDTNGYMNESDLYQIVISDTPPDILSVYMSDNYALSAYTDCSTSSCNFNPVSGTNITLAVNITTSDVDNDCDTVNYGKTILYLCLNSTNLAGCGDNTNNNFTIIVENVTRRGSVCEWKFNTNLTNITPQFFIPTGNYMYYINATSQSGIRSMTNDIEANGSWVYGSLQSVNYPSSIELGDGSIDLGQWNPGTSPYNMTNYGNVIITGIRWNSTDYTKAGANKNWTLSGWDFLLDDDTSVTAETSGKIYPLNITNTTAQYFNYSTGLQLCITKECNAASLNETMDTYWHIYPPTGLSPGTYTGVITYVIE